MRPSISTTIATPIAAVSVFRRPCGPRRKTWMRRPRAGRNLAWAPGSRIERKWVTSRDPIRLGGTAEPERSGFAARCRRFNGAADCGRHSVDADDEAWLFRAV